MASRSDHGWRFRQAVAAAPGLRQLQQGHRPQTLHASTCRCLHLRSNVIATTGSTRRSLREGPGRHGGTMARQIRPMKHRPCAGCQRQDRKLPDHTDITLLHQPRRPIPRRTARKAGLRLLIRQQLSAALPILDRWLIYFDMAFFRYQPPYLHGAPANKIKPYRT